MRVVSTGVVRHILLVSASSDIRLQWEGQGTQEVVAIRGMRSSTLTQGKGTQALRCPRCTMAPARAIQAVAMLQRLRPLMEDTTNQAAAMPAMQHQCSPQGTLLQPPIPATATPGMSFSTAMQVKAGQKSACSKSIMTPKA